MSQLAIHGGEPVFPAGPPTWPRPSEAVREALAAAYADGSWGRYHGAYCQRLREAIAAEFNVPHVWLCASGTFAVELALRGLKVGVGDEVILAAYDFPGNFRAIEATGARPVLVDAGSGSWVIDAEQVAAAISPQTKAMIVSHLHGSLADMPRLRQIADERQIAIVEDACQVPGAVIGKKSAGTWGDCGILSFGGSKLLTAGRGGAVITQRDDVLQRIKIFCDRGNDAFPLSELQAAVLLPQLGELPAQNRHRHRAAKNLLDQCVGLPRLAPLTLPANAEDLPAFYKLPWLLGNNSDDCSQPEFEEARRTFIKAVQAEGVALDEGFRGFARRSTQRCRAVGDLCHAQRTAAQTVLLHHPVLLESDEVISRVAAALRKVAAALL